MNTTPKPAHQVLLAVDGSEHSLAAVKTVRDFALAAPDCPECQVKVLGVFPVSEGSNHAMYLIPLREAGRILGEHGVRTVSDLIQGYPAEVILRQAAANRPDLIVIGARGLRATLGILLGGVAQQVVEHARCPVLVVRAPYRPIDHVLVVTDGSECSRQAVEFAAGFPFIQGTDFHLLHVLPPSPVLTPEVLSRIWNLPEEAIDPSIFANRDVEAEVEAARTAGQAVLDEANQVLLSHGIQARKALLQGDAATEIIQYARDHQIDLVIAGSRGLSPMQSWLLGSVSRKLVHYAECSVLLVKQPEELDSA
jgi:nucleotide-binding universal stress UspA family protein